MPDRDGTGPRGQGKGRGKGRGKGFGGPPPIDGECICTACGHTIPHRRGFQCNKQTCSKCSSPMTRKQ